MLFLDVVSYYPFSMSFPLLYAICVFLLCSCAVSVIGLTAAVPAHF
jgi:hypothetical protein